MARTPSNMMPLGTVAPSFNLADTVSGDTFTLEELKGTNGTLLYFICNHCPFVIHVIEELVAVSNDYIESGISTIAISSNDVENYPQDSPENMKIFAKDYGINFPYLFDESQDIAKAYDAACTPDIYLFDSNLKCVYRGQLDGSRPGNEVPVNGADLRNAIDNLLNGTEISSNQLPSIGCNIKWK